jgi:hypothetical protein
VRAGLPITTICLAVVVLLCIFCIAEMKEVLGQLLYMDMQDQLRLVCDFV